MSEPYKGRLEGHTLLKGGRPEVLIGSITCGIKKCSCGAQCFCASTNDARTWHRQHKADVIAALAKARGEAQ